MNIHSRPPVFWFGEGGTAGDYVVFLGGGGGAPARWPALSGPLGPSSQGPERREVTPIEKWTSMNRVARD